VDNSTRQPLAEAQVLLFTQENEGSSFLASARTNASGIYEVEAKPGDLLIYAYFDLESTLGIDYVPGRRDVSVEEQNLEVSFALLPGATIMTEEEADPRNYHWMQGVYFDLFDQHGPLHLPDSVWSYGDHFDSRALNSSSRAIVVPSGIPVRVSATILLSKEDWGSAPVFSFWIDQQGRYLNVNQGDLLSVNLGELALRFYADNVLYTHWQSTQASASRLEKAGFYIYYEKTGLLRAEKLLNSARSSLSEGDYDGAYASLHEADLVLKDLEESLTSMLTNAPHSAFFISPLLGFTTVAAASILCQERWKRLKLSLVLYGTLFSLLFLLYPGYTVIWESDYRLEALTAPGSLIILLLAVVSLLGPLLLTEGLPSAYRERASAEGLCILSALTAAFSIAARNMKRRRLRTILTFSFMTIAVLGFTVLTSLSLEYGLSIQPLPGQAPSEGFLVRKPLVNQPSSFRAVEPAILEWLQGHPEVTSLAPKLENTPGVVSGSAPPFLGTLQTPGSDTGFNISGILGIYPSLEVEATGMGSMIVQGRFLSDEGLNGILISEEAAEELHVRPNDTLLLYGQEFNLTGVFNDGKLSGLTDLDGASLVPQYVSVAQTPGGLAYIPNRVPSGEVVILHGEAIKGLPLNMMVSRVNVQTRSRGDDLALARLAVLTWPGVEAFASSAGRVQRLFIGSHGVARGFIEATVPLVIVVLSVGVMMLSAVYERRREVTIMSCVGLNPTHIGAVFVAEALTLGLLAGSLGYLLGLVSYRPMSMLSAAVEVRPKVEASWGIVVLCFSIAATLIGFALPAGKASVIATPSLIRRWKLRMEERPKKKEEPWLFHMPIQIRGEDLERFFGFMEDRLRGYVTYRQVDGLKVSGRGAATHLSFTHTFTYGMDRAGVTENELLSVETLPNRYGIQLASRTPRGLPEELEKAYVRETAALIRQFILRYGHRGGGRVSASLSEVSPFGKSLPLLSF